MSLFEYSTYLCCVTVLLLLSVVLFSFKTEHKLGAFHLVKCDLAISMIFYAIVFSLYLYYGVNYHSIAIPNCYIAPFYYYYAFFFLSLGVRHVLHAPKAPMRRINWLTLPLIIVGTIDFIIYIITRAKHLDFTFRAYLYYVHQPIGMTFAYIIYLLCFSGIMWMFFRIIRHETAFQISIENYYANEMLIARLYKRYRWYMMVGYTFVLMSILLDLSTSFYEFHMAQTQSGLPLPAMTYPIMALLVCTILTSFSIIIFNSQYAYNQTSEAFDTNKEKTIFDTSEDDITDDEAEEEMASTDDNKNANENVSTRRYNDASLIEQRLKDWEKDEERPYLSESLTITKVANDLEISNRQLSEYLNYTLGINFNTYINQLRVNYIKKMLTDSPGMTISELAFHTGFTDASALTKVFKRFTGTTPSKYRTNK